MLLIPRSCIPIQDTYSCPEFVGVGTETRARQRRKLRRDNHFATHTPRGPLVRPFSSLSSILPPLEPTALDGCVPKPLVLRASVKEKKRKSSAKAVRPRSFTRALQQRFLKVFRLQVNQSRYPSIQEIQSPARRECCFGPSAGSNITAKTTAA